MNPQEIVAALVGIVLTVALLALWRLRRRPDHLTYVVPPRPGIKGAFDGIATFNTMLVYGSCSTDEWKRRCEASRCASRRRRGLPVDQSITVELRISDGRRFTEQLEAARTSLDALARPRSGR
jgi:hypothetical protein